ncbi:unnamed protein product [Bathycoccus prasinos]
MDATRDVAVKLMKESKVQIEQNGEVLRDIQSAKDLKGRIRLRLVEKRRSKTKREFVVCVSALKKKK